MRGISPSMPCVARVVHLAELGVVGEGGRRNVERAAPEHELLLAELLEGLGLVLALQRAVVALVEAPRALDGDPRAIGGVEGDVGGLDGAGEHRGVQDVGQQARLGEQLAAALGFGLALLGEPDVDPSGEEVELVPFALAVAEEDQRIGRGHAAMIPTAGCSRAAWHHWLMATGRSPVGQVTRGTTGTNRLRRVDRWIARHPALRRAADPLVVDLGYGASAVTTLELHARLARARARRRGARAWRSIRRASRGPRDQLTTVRRGAHRVRRATRGCRSRSAASRCPSRRAAARRDPRHERAAAVPGGRGRRRLGAHVRPAGAGRACSSRAPATSSAASSTWVAVGARRAAAVAHGLAAAGGARASVHRGRAAAEGPHPPQRARRAGARLPRGARRRVGAGGRGRAVRAGAPLGDRAQRRWRAAGWPLEGRSRWRLGEITVPWRGASRRGRG